MAKRIIRETVTTPLGNRTSIYRRNCMGGYELLHRYRVEYTLEYTYEKDGTRMCTWKKKFVRTTRFLSTEPARKNSERLRSN